MLNKILIANRSEIALRIQATCHARGIKTVAICSPEDRTMSYVGNAHEAYQLSGNGYPAYLAQQEIIDIALKSGAQAIHPGYGFLSENATFAQAVLDAGLVWIGPKPECIALMADKIVARNTAQQANVPTVPGFFVNDISEQACLDAEQQANALGYPVIIKDPRSGGGKAMRRVDSAVDFAAALTMIAAEALKFTGSTQLLVEKYIQHGRHIEIQVAGDGTHVIHLFERECSLQRRHQKIVEEAPCNFVSKQTLEAMYTAALRVTQAAHYNSIGTVEFIVTPDEQFYFLEMNTRLQVEHAVTEMITGVDLVNLQLHIAEHNQLPYAQTDITQKGHAIQCRLYTEDPASNFAPATGTFTQVTIPHQPFVRMEHDIAQGSEITPFFDPMFARVITWSDTRHAASSMMQQYLDRLILEGVITNKTFLRALVASTFFEFGAFHTQFLADKSIIQQILHPDHHNSTELVYAGLAVALAEFIEQKNSAPIHSPKIRRRWKDQQWL